MADVTLDIVLIPELELPYEAGAEGFLDAAASAAFTAVGAASGVALTLVPTFDLAPSIIGDMLAAARQGGSEASNLRSWYKLSCPEDVADAIVASLATLPFVVFAGVRAPAVPAAWEVETDPRTSDQRYLRAPHYGINAFAAWQVPGGGGRGARVADVEHAWDLTHPDLAGAAVAELAEYPLTNGGHVDHGTAGLGIVGAWTDGSMLTGIAPWADLAVSPAGNDSGAAILRAANHVGRGGVILLELAHSFSADWSTPDAPLEIQPSVWKAIRDATDHFQVLVVEPTGNGEIDLDNYPLYPLIEFLFTSDHDSGALLVGAATDLDPNSFTHGTTWRAAGYTSFGTAVRCFGPGDTVMAPSAAPDNPLRPFSGTSAAGAVVAGVAAALQGAAIAATGAPLSPADLRLLLMDERFGTPVSGQTPTKAGTIPDLLKLLDGLGIRRIPPLTALKSGPLAASFIRSGRRNINEMEIFHWDEAFQQWTLWTATGQLQGQGVLAVSGHPVALTRSGGPGRIDAVNLSEGGGLCHRTIQLVTPAGTPLGLDEPWNEVSTNLDDESFQISSPLSAVASGDLLLVAGLSAIGGALVAMAERTADGGVVVPTETVSGAVTGHEPSFAKPDPAVSFRCPPQIVDAPLSVVLVGTDSDGWIRAGNWAPDEGWSTLEKVDPGQVSLDPRQPLGLVPNGADLHVLGVDPFGTLVETVGQPNEDGVLAWSPMRSVAAPLPGLSIAAAGALVAAGDGDGRLAAMALDANGLPVTTIRLPGEDWAPLFFVPTLTGFVLRGGLALASPAPRVFIAAAADANGTIHAARWTPGGWSCFLPVP